MTALPSTGYHPHPERTDTDFEKLHSAYHDALEIIAHRDYRVAELESENESLRALTIRQANQLSSFRDRVRVLESEGTELREENTRLHQLLTSCQQNVSTLSDHIDADHAYMRKQLGNGAIVAAHNPHLPPDVGTMVAGEAAAARKQIAADDGPEAVYEREGFGEQRHDLELFNSTPALAAVGPPS